MDTKKVTDEIFEKITTIGKGEIRQIKAILDKYALAEPPRYSTTDSPDIKKTEGYVERTPYRPDSLVGPIGVPPQQELHVDIETPRKVVERAKEAFESIRLIAAKYPGTITLRDGDCGRPSHQSLQFNLDELEVLVAQENKKNLFDEYNKTVADALSKISWYKDIPADQTDRLNKILSIHAEFISSYVLLT